MTDTPMPDWVLIEAAKRCGWGEHLAHSLQAEHKHGPAFRALCDMILKHEQPPVDPLVEAWDEAWKLPHNSPDKLAVFRKAIEARGGKIVWEEGFGK